MAAQQKDIVNVLFNKKSTFTSLQVNIAHGLQKLIDDYYSEEAGAVDAAKYLTNLKDELLPKFLLVHFEGKKLPGTDVVISADNIDDAIKRVDAFGRKIEAFAQAATGYP